MKPNQFLRVEWLAVGLSCLLLPAYLPAASHPSQGLWVGEVILNKVNEVSVPIGSDNYPVAPNPTNATPTKDAAKLRLILHVDGTGAARILKSVAVIDKTRLTTTPASTVVTLTNLSQTGIFGSAQESNIVLLTDESLYANYPGPALRYASAAFDFSDRNAILAAKAASAKVNAGAAAAASTGKAAATSTPLNTVSNDIWTAAMAAAVAAPAVGADLQVMTNVIKSVTSATLEAVSRARYSSTPAAIARARIDEAATTTAAFSLDSQVRSVGAVPITKVPMTGSLVAGGTLAGTFTLGDDHPTNPFRHKFHPDHQYGYEITRNLTLRVGTPSGGGGFEPGGFGVDRLTGIYREEVLGLHKPLGPNRDIGLITEGSFTLNRVTLKSTLDQ